MCGIYVFKYFNVCDSYMHSIYLLKIITCSIVLKFVSVKYQFILCVAICWICKVNKAEFVSVCRWMESTKLIFYPTHNVATYCDIIPHCENFIHCNIINHYIIVIYYDSVTIWDNH